MSKTTPITPLPDGSGFFTATVMSDAEAKALPLKDRPLNHRISSEMYHAVFEAIGFASMCWTPKPEGVFDSSSAEKCAVELCLKIAAELEKKAEVAAKVRKALADLVGCDGKDELTQMDAVMRTMPIPERDRTNMLNAIHALEDTLP